MRVTEESLRVTQTPSFPAAIAFASAKLTGARSTTRLVPMSIRETVRSGLIAHTLPRYGASRLRGDVKAAGVTLWSYGSGTVAITWYVSGSIRATLDVCTWLPRADAAPELV